MDTQSPQNLEEGIKLPLVEIIRDPNTAAVLLKPPRPAVLAALRTPASASGLARRLQQPRQHLGHHLRNLEKVGLVRLAAERRHAGLTERIFQATARSYLLSPTLLGDLGALAPEDVLCVDGSGWPPLAAVAERMLQDVAVLSEQRGDDIAALAVPTQVRFAFWDESGCGSLRTCSHRRAVEFGRSGLEARDVVV